MILNLPDPLLFNDKRPVTSINQWSLRRAELLELFRTHVYGRTPLARPANLRLADPIIEISVFQGLGLHRFLRATYNAPAAPGGFDLPVFLPSAAPPRGCLLLIVNRERTILSEAAISSHPFWPVRDILARGYATAAIHISDFAPDNPSTCFSEGLFRLFPALQPSSERSSDAWGALGVWAWGASRALDLLLEDPVLSQVPMGIVGHSRGGKAALWCAAQDARVSLAVSNESGRAGAAVGRLSRGETIAHINHHFPHWFAPAYHAYGASPESLPVDQHQLLALLAPRLAYIASAAEDAHADPWAEFHGGLLASPVYRFLGHAGLEPASYPSVGQSCHAGRIGYHLRSGGHDLLPEDWLRFLDFADQHWSGAESRDIEQRGVNF